jgi:hypothetical protein
MKNTTPTAKVNHSTREVSYKHLHFSIEKIKQKISKGAELTHFLPNSQGYGSFVTLKERDKKGQVKCWFLEPSPELLRLDHRFAASAF